MKVRDALAMAAQVAAGRSSLPILAHVRVSGGLSSGAWLAIVVVVGWLFVIIQTFRGLL